VKENFIERKTTMAKAILERLNSAHQPTSYAYQTALEALIRKPSMHELEALDMLTQTMRRPQEEGSR